jgi:hypothetical protein
MPVENVITANPLSAEALRAGIPGATQPGMANGWFNNMFGALRRIFPSGPLAGEYGVKSSQPVLSPFQANPVEEPHPTMRPGQTTAALGGSGTPIYAGFVTDLGEYNGKLQGINAFPIYEQMRRSDPDVRAALLATKLPIRCAQYEVVPGVTAASPLHSFAVEIADFVRENLFGGLESMTSTGFMHSQSFESVLENALLNLDFGCSSHEILWHVDGSHVRIRKLAPRLPMTFYRFYPDTDGETLLAYEQYGYRGDSYVNVIIPAEKVDFFNYDKEGADFYGRSALRAAYASWYIKSNLYRLDCIAIERNGMGIPVITLAENADDDDKAYAQRFVTMVATHEQTGLTLPFGHDFKLAGMTGRIRDPKTSIQAHSEQILRSFLAQFIAFGTTATGSRSLSSDMITFFKLGLNAIARGMTTTMSNSSIRRLVDFNYGDSRKQIPYPRLRHSNIAALDPMELAEKIKNLAQWQVDLVQPDDELENWFRHEYGMPPKTTMRSRWMPVQQRIMEQPAPGVTPDELEAGKDPGGPKPVVDPIHPTQGNDPPQPGTAAKGNYDPGTEPNPHRSTSGKVDPASMGKAITASDADSIIGMIEFADATSQRKIANRKIGWDFDGTICLLPATENRTFIPGKFGKLSENAKILLRRIADAGFTNVVFTARTDLASVRAWIKSYNLPIETVSNEKVPTLAIVDDRGIHIDWGVKRDDKKIDSVLKALRKVAKQHDEDI